MWLSSTLSYPSPWNIFYYLIFGQNFSIFCMLFPVTVNLHYHIGKEKHTSILISQYLPGPLCDPTEAWPSLDSHPCVGKLTREGYGVGEGLWMGTAPGSAPAREGTESWGQGAWSWTVPPCLWIKYIVLTMGSQPRNCCLSPSLFWVKREL